MHHQCRSNPSGAKLTAQRLEPVAQGRKDPTSQVALVNMSGELSDDHVSQKRRAGMAAFGSSRYCNVRRDARVSQAHYPGLVSFRQNDHTTKGFQRQLCLVSSRCRYIRWDCLVMTARHVGLARRDTLTKGKLRHST
jgi:hypothetical protein